MQRCRRVALGREKHGACAHLPRWHPIGPCRVAAAIHGRRRCCRRIRQQPQVPFDCIHLRLQRVVLPLELRKPLRRRKQGADVP